jgi:adenylyltransferase/sulfurtransferase
MAEENRYSRQERFAPIGAEGQAKLLASHIAIIGCGALGSVLAETLVRAGVGRINLVDRDFIELSNLQRQFLFDEADIAQNLPKAEAAARKLRKMNSEVEITPFIADANHESIEIFTDGVDLILDGTDNLHTRYLINDLAVRRGVPWIYGAAQAASGMTLVILPGGKPCLRCVFDCPPEPGQLETCETAGILGPLIAMVAGHQALEAIKILTGNLEAVNRKLVSFDPWINRQSQLTVNNLSGGCACCGNGQFEFLSGKASLSTVALCGRNAVQLRPKKKGLKIDLEQMASRLAGAGNIDKSEFMLRLEIGEHQLTLFPDGRTIVKGTEDKDTARSLYGKYIGY